jgi:hypothetical protein
MQIELLRRNADNEETGTEAIAFTPDPFEASGADIEALAKAMREKLAGQGFAIEAFGDGGGAAHATGPGLAIRVTTSAGSLTTPFLRFRRPVVDQVIARVNGEG